MLYRTIWLLLDSIHRLVCGSFSKDHNVSETGSVSVLSWMGQDRPTKLDPSERASLNHWTSFEKLPRIRRWIESKRSQIVPSNCYIRILTLQSHHIIFAVSTGPNLIYLHSILHDVKPLLISEQPKSSIFWDITSTNSASYLLQGGSLLGLFFSPEDGDIFLRNFHWLPTNCMSLYPRKQNSS
jgi:hypothetical protein